MWVGVVMQEEWFSHNEHKINDRRLCRHLMLPISYSASISEEQVRFRFIAPDLSTWSGLLIYGKRLYRKSTSHAGVCHFECWHLRDKTADIQKGLADPWECLEHSQQALSEQGRLCSWLEMAGNYKPSGRHKMTFSCSQIKKAGWAHTETYPSSRNTAQMMHEMLRILRNKE